MQVHSSQFFEELDSKPVYRFALNRNRRVHILDENPEVLASISTLFRLEGFEVEAFDSVPQFRAAFAGSRIDVAVINFDVDGNETLPLLEEIRAISRGVVVFMLSDAPNVERTVAAMRSGATDVLVKPVAAERLIDGARDALRHQVLVMPPVHGQRRVEIRGFSMLTERERQVLQLLVDGKSNKEIGRGLGISSRTVEVHRARIMEKMGARNSADLIRIVLTA